MEFREAGDDDGDEYLNGASLGFEMDRLAGETLGRLSLIGYLFGTTVTIWSFFPEFMANWALLHVALVFFLGQVIDAKQYSVWWRSCLLGCVLSLGIILSSNYIAHGLFFSLGWYIIFLSLFHYLEYLVTALTNPSNLSVDSFLLNHSPAYGVAVAASFIEFGIEVWLFPSMKQNLLISSAGALICCLGDTLRKLAMFHAGTNFNHLVQFHKSDHHQLITTGVFGWVRHPSYVGWFFWSVATQVMLCNPFCLVAYGLVSWKFFDERIYTEEYTLLNFFGSQYLEYQKRVPVGVPFVKGFRVVEKEA